MSLSLRDLLKAGFSTRQGQALLKLGGLSWLAENEDGNRSITARAQCTVVLTDADALAGTGNGLYWVAGSEDGAAEQGLDIYVGPNGEHELTFLGDGVLKVDGAPVGGSSAAPLDHLSARYVWSAVASEYATLDWAAAARTVAVVSGDGVTAEVGAAPQLSVGTWAYTTWAQIAGADAARFFEFYNNASDSLDSSAQWSKAGAAPGTSGIVVVTEPLDLMLDVDHSVGSAQNVTLNVTFVKIA